MKVQITYEGHVAEMKIKALTSAVLSGLLRPMLGDVNVVSAPVVAKERGMVVDEIDARRAERLRKPDHGHRHHRAAGALGLRHGLCRRQAAAGRHQGHPRRRRIRQVDDLRHQRGQAGLHRPLRGLLGDAKINIATFHLGRDKQGGDAIALVEVDGAVPADVLAKVQALPQVKQAKALRF